jgi:hypothetical protein
MSALSRKVLRKKHENRARQNRTQRHRTILSRRLPRQINVLLESQQRAATHSRARPLSTAVHSVIVIFQRQLAC